MHSFLDEYMRCSACQNNWVDFYVASFPQAAKFKVCLFLVMKSTITAQLRMTAENTIFLSPSE